MKAENCRTAMLIGGQNMEKLANSHVCVFGLGGVGSYTVEALARAGVGALTLVDGDSIALSNINRQLYALHSTIGLNKTRAARLRVKDINPDCRLTEISDFVNSENINSFFKQRYDFCIDAVDDSEAKTAIALKCEQLSIPFIAAMGTGCKISSENFRICDIYKTEYCPLCRVMRKKYREAGLKKVTVLFSPDSPQECKYDISPADAGEKRPPSSISFVPSVAGLKLAEYAVRKICGI